MVELSNIGIKKILVGSSLHSGEIGLKFSLWFGVSE
jgi:uncharacterized protein related to proFAR isomerase